MHDVTISQVEQRHLMKHNHQGSPRLMAYSMYLQSVGYLNLSFFCMHFRRLFVVSEFVEFSCFDLVNKPLSGDWYVG